MPRQRPNFTEWMQEYHRLVAVARSQGVRVHDYSDRRVPTHVAQQRCEDLARQINQQIRLIYTPLNTTQAPAAPVEIAQQNVLDALRTNRPVVTETWTPAPSLTAHEQRLQARAHERELRQEAAHRATRARLRAAQQERGPRGQPYTPASGEFRSMDPTEFTFGAEFEFIIPNQLNQARIAAALNEAGVPCHGELYNHFTRAHWKVITDGSIQNRPGYVGFEAVSPILQGADGFSQIEKVCDVLVALGATVNRSCGFHVHIGITDNMNRPEFFKRLVGHYCANESHIDAILAPSRRGSANTYCQPISSVVKDAIDRAQTVPQIIAQVPSRFSKVNLQSFWRHRTVEFRHHQGTIEKTKAISWIKFCMHLVSTATKPEPVEQTTNLLSFLCSLKIPAEEVGYFCNRYAHFLSGADNHA